MSTCVVCRGPAAAPEPLPGLRGEDGVLHAAVCSPPCRDLARRHAARRAVQLAPARAGVMVALLGLVTGALFAVSGRDLGRPLVVLALLGAGTTRLAYPDAGAAWL